jgi:hypothetical protein
MEKSEIVARLDEITKAIRLRMDEVDPIMIGLLPTELDWATHEERDESHRLKLLLPSYGEEMQAARERLKQKMLKRQGKGTKD